MTTEACRTCAVLAAAALADGKFGYVMCGRCQASATVEVPIDDHATEFGTPLLPVPRSVLRGIEILASLVSDSSRGIAVTTCVAYLNADEAEPVRAVLAWLRTSSARP